MEYIPELSNSSQNLGLAQTVNKLNSVQNPRSGQIPETTALAMWGGGGAQRTLGAPLPSA